MLFKSEVVTQASGSIGGTTYSHNRGGMYRRARAIPVNPATAFQAEVRAVFSAASQAWLTDLTNLQRAGWEDYAANVPVTNVLGDQVNLTGQQWFVAANSPRLQAASKFPATSPLPAIVTTAPTIFDRGSFTTPTVTLSAATGITLTYEAADAWANEDDAYMLIWQGRPRSVTRNFYRGPYRLVHVIAGAVLGLTPPEVIAPAVVNVTGFPLLQGNVDRLQVSVLRADGRMSERRNVGFAASGNPDPVITA